MRKPFHVGYSPLTKRIYAGHVAKDGVSWLAGNSDVTTEALLAVVGYIEPGNVSTLMATDGSHSFEITVRRVEHPTSAKGGAKP
ncbi:DUF7446 family protein [Methylorubrum extorquens]|uniref:Uncharacterized protein n=1 Tax=Methylorubrum extorquens DSM 13060 TaxID=882800 RepID=H1KKP0_METEX|nr:hypothetical protein [Methylorubrum extorquens]EHP91891.1 hypothetical protein MetexDRAFT_3202 [Methylorubrum extorquens DSM 13060]